MQKRSHAVNVTDGFREANNVGLNVNTERLLTFRALCQRIPRRRAERPVALSTVHRWRAFGIRGVRLEAVRVGGSWLTSEEAFTRFTQRLTAAADHTAKEIMTSMPCDNSKLITEERMDRALGIKK